MGIVKERSDCGLVVRVQDSEEGLQHSWGSMGVI